MAKNTIINKITQEFTIDSAAPGEGIQDSYITFSLVDDGGFKCGVDYLYYPGSFNIDRSAKIGDQGHFIINATGERRERKQPAFLAYLGTTQAGATGNGTVATVKCNTEVFDQGSDYNTGTWTFTAPVAGKYFFSINVSAYAAAANIPNIQTQIVTSNRTFTNVEYLSGATNAWGDFSVVTDMDAVDTAYFTIMVTGLGADLVHFSTNGTYASGYLVC